MLHLHATSIAIKGQAILLIGPSGSGKSDLALRLLQEGAELIADDQTILRACDHKVFASCPPNIQGKIEIRGIGILNKPVVSWAPVRLCISLVPYSQVPRLPAPQYQVYEGVLVPFVFLDPSSASASIKVNLALNIVLSGLSMIV